MRRCNSTGQGRSRILPRARTIGAALERRNRVLVGMFEGVCRSVGRPLFQRSALGCCAGVCQEGCLFLGGRVLIRITCSTSVRGGKCPATAQLYGHSLISDGSQNVRIQAIDEATLAQTGMAGVMFVCHVIENDGQWMC